MSAASAACTLLILQTQVRPTETGWREQVRAEISATPDCQHVDIDLPPGVRLGSHKARIRFGDGIRRKVDEHQFEVHPRTLDDEGSVRLHLNELLGGDTVHLDYERIWTTDGPFHWQPGHSGPLHAELKASSSLSHTATGVQCDTPQSCWVSEPGPTAGVVLSQNTEGEAVSSTPTSLPPTSRPVEIHRKLTIGVPPGDPQLRLYPGGGAIQHWEVFLSFEGEDRRRGLRVPLPQGHDALSVAVEPPDGIQAHVYPDGVIFEVEASDGPARASLSYDVPDAPTFGEVPEGETLEVEARNGRVQWEGRTWWLAAIHGRPILPSRKTLERALDSRFRALSIPQPGIPNALRGRTLDWELVGELRPALSERARPATWPSDPLFPRKLIRARKSGSLSETEAMLILWLQAHELALDAQWLLVRPATDGPGYTTSPAGYDHGLLLVGLDGESRWIDPACMVCGPFEVRPFLEEASALGGGLIRTGAPTPGVWSALVGGDGVRWELAGSAALALRMWLDPIPSTERRQALAERMAGPHATLVDVTGVGEAGAPITATATRGGGIITDPLSLPPLRDDGTTWVDTVGERWVRWAGREAPESTYEGDALSYRRYTEEGDLIEVLTVRQREIGASDVEGLQNARALTRSPAPAPVEGDGSPAEAPAAPEQEPEPAEEPSEEEGAGGVGTGAEAHEGGVPYHEDPVKDPEERR